MGPRELKRDIANRLFLYRGDLTQELNWYHPHGAAIAEAFVRGVNAYIDQTAKNPALLSPEFRMLGIKPGKWTMAIVISRFNGLRGNLDEEMNTALAVRAVGAEAVKDLQHDEPADPDLRIDPAIDASLLSKTYWSFTTSTGRSWNSRRMSFCRTTPASGAIPERKSFAPTAQEMSDRRADMGSNNWVVSGRLTRKRLADPGGRSPSHAGDSLAALLGASERAGLECDRLGRAVDPRRLLRP